MSVIDPYKRYQKGLCIEDLYPTRLDGYCSCGCMRKISGKRRKWFSDDCRLRSLERFYIVKGDTDVIRDVLLRQDGGGCRSCGEITNNWEADHIIPVFYGGGGCDIDNFQTLCVSCHQEKTSLLNSLPRPLKFFTTMLNDFPSSGVTIYVLQQTNYSAGNRFSCPLGFIPLVNDFK